MKNLIESHELRNREFVFADRSDAGRRLGEILLGEEVEHAMLLAIPSGGVPVAVAMQLFLWWPLELLLVRKIQIPHNTEAGFGAVNMDGERFYNQTLLDRLHLSWEIIDSQAQKADETINQRNMIFRCNKPFPDIRNKNIFIVDDGLASGYTMLAAIHYVRNRNPSSINIAVPTGTADTVETLSSEVDRLYCLNIRESYPFAVASAYRNWYDLSDKEVLHLLERDLCL